MASKESILKFADCVRFITEQKYADALSTLKNSLGELVESKRASRGRDLATLFMTVVLALEDSLQKAYGHRWETQIPKASVPKASETREKLTCSFCGKDQDEVRKLIAGPRVYICDECIELCNDVIENELDEKGLISPGSTPGKK